MPLEARLTLPGLVREPGVCARCVLPETMPGVILDSEGVCQYCRQGTRQAEQELKGEYLARFEELLGRWRRHAPRDGYDVILAYSGGKDSTWALKIFRERWDLRVLAVTFDNSFVPEAALANIRRMTDRLGADHLLVRPDPALMRRIFRAAAEKSLFPERALIRASSICTACISLVKGIILRTALEKGIPFVGWGWSPGQAPIQSSVMRLTPGFVRLTQKTLHEPLRSVVGEVLRPYFLEESSLGAVLSAVQAGGQAGEDDDRALFSLPHNVHPLAFLDYDETAIMGSIQAMGWVRPSDTDPNSTNCLLNSLGNALHLEQHGFHPYAMEIAGIVRSGGMTREEGLAKLAAREKPEVLSRVRQALFGPEVTTVRGGVGRGAETRGVDARGVETREDEG